MVWFDGRDGHDAPPTARHGSPRTPLPELLAGSPIEIASSWTPSAGENDPNDVPMDLGSHAGGPERLCQLFFVNGDVARDARRLPPLHRRVEAEPVWPTSQLVAPFFRTVVGTDRYVDELW